MDNRSDFLKVIFATRGAFTSSGPMDDVALEMYWENLRDLEFADFKRAAMRAVRECRFFPTVAELRSLAAQSVAQRAVLAWEAVLKVFGRRLFGCAGLWVFDDPVITAAITNLGGCRRLDTCVPDDRDGWVRKEFLRIYPLIHAASLDPAHVAPLRGTNRNNGVPIDQIPKEVRVAKTGLPWALESDQLGLAPPARQQSLLTAGTGGQS